MVSISADSGGDGGDQQRHQAGGKLQSKTSPKLQSITVPINEHPQRPTQDGFANELHRNSSNQSTIDSALSRNSHLDMNDQNIRRMFGLASSGSAERQRRLRLLMDQCETVRFPFKKRLILANLNLSHDEIPVDQICSDRLGSALYKLSLAGNRLHSIPEQLIAKLTGLRVLDFSQCDLHRIPEKWDLPSLKKLNLSHNCIKGFLAEVSCFVP